VGRTSKKGQVTVFIILGIVILLAITIVILYTQHAFDAAGDTEISKPILLAADVQKIRTHTEKCIETVAEKAVLILGLQGGYTSLRDIPSTNIIHAAVQNETLPEFKGTAYSYHAATNKIPAPEDAAKNLESHLNEEIPKKCKTTRQGLTIYYGQPTSKVTLSDADVKVSATWPITIRKGGAESNLQRSYNIQVPVRLKTLLQLLKKGVDEQAAAGQDICISCWTALAANDNLKIEIQKISDTTFFLVKDEKSGVRDSEYMFIAAIKRGQGEP